MAVAGHDLGRDRLSLESEAFQHALLEIGRRGGVRPDRARDGADGGLRERALQPAGIAVGLEREAGELDPERRRLGVDPVGAPHAERVGVLARAGGERGYEAAGVGQHQLAGAPQLQGEPRVQDIARGEPVVDPAPGRSGAVRQDVDERRRVVVGDLLALVDLLDGERGGADRAELFRARAVHLFAGRDLDLAHRVKARMVGPELSQLAAGVARDHVAKLTVRPAAACRLLPRPAGSSRAARESGPRDRRDAACSGGSFPAGAA